MDFLQYLHDFGEHIVMDRVEIYNEVSLQFELAIYLRNILSDNFRVHVERNVAFFGLNKGDYLKREMDIAVFTPDKQEKHCFELKFPTRGQYPEQMFSACKDIRFLEQLVKSGFNESYFIMFADDPLFYVEKGGESIYKAFRAEKLIKGEIIKPTGKRDEKLILDGEYKIEWQNLPSKLKYFIVQVKI